MKLKRPRGRPLHDDVLTPTEWSIVHAVQHGLTTREIARRRGVSTDAVKFHVTNASAKLGVPNRRMLRRWFKAPKGSALSSQEKPMSSTLEIGPIGQIARSVKDIGQAESWYAHTLGSRHLYTYGQVAFFDCGGVRLMLSQSEGEPAAESILYLRVPDIKQAHDALAARGIEFVSAPHLIHRHADGTEEWMAFFKDPEGRPLAIMSQLKR